MWLFKDIKENKTEYSFVDNQIAALIKEYESNPFLEKLESEEQRKSYGFLIWFLKKYAPYLKDIENYILII